MRTIKSFVRRNGRMTCAQQLAFKNLWPVYGIDIPDNNSVIASAVKQSSIEPGLPRCARNDGSLDFQAIFGRNKPTVLEIGFGNGEALVAMAIEKPEINFIGVDVYESGTGALFNILQEKNITNVRVVHKDVILLLSGVIPAHSLLHVYIYFPDPWPKKKHRKRRLLQTDFLDLIKKVLVPQGYIHFATDWQDYARHAQAVLSQHPDFKMVLDKTKIPDYCPRPTTKFYRKALQLGHVITDLSYQAL